MITVDMEKKLAKVSYFGWWNMRINQKWSNSTLYTFLEFFFGIVMFILIKWNYPRNLREMKKTWYFGWWHMQINPEWLKMSWMRFWRFFLTLCHFFLLNIIYNSDPRNIPNMRKNKIFQTIEQIKSVGNTYRKRFFLGGWGGLLTKRHRFIIWYAAK